METQRSLIKTHLRSLGFKGTIVEADGVDAAYNALKEQHTKGEPIELVISDWNMPGAPGIDFLKKLRSGPAFQKLPFLMITAETRADQVIEAAEAGVSNFVVKPFTPEILQKKLSQIWRKHFGKGK